MDSKFGYTKQADLLRFGERWGCYFCALINIVEHFRGRQFTVQELWTAVGACTLNETMRIANYKKHTHLREREPKGWGPADDPEWHFLIEDQRRTIQFIARSVTILDVVEGNYFIEEWKTKYGSHFVAVIDDEQINPDPKIKCQKVIGVRGV